MAIGTTNPLGAESTAYPKSDDARKWTVMIFMGAESIEGNEPLDQVADDDLDCTRAGCG